MQMKFDFLLRLPLFRMNGRGDDVQSSAWTPGQDICNFYDYKKLQGQMKDVVAKSASYIAELQSRLDFVQKEIDENQCVKDFNDAGQALLNASENLGVDEIVKVTKNYLDASQRFRDWKKSADKEALDNENFYLQELIDDVKRTVGDELCALWWNAIPESCKKKFVKYADDKIIEILASDEKLFTYLRNFENNMTNGRFYKNFMKLVEQKFNFIFGLKNKEKVKMQAYYDPKAPESGYRFDNNKIGVNVAHIKDLDDLVGIIKHEFLGHWVDFNCPNFGLRGETMQKFVTKELYNVSGHILVHGCVSTHIDVAKSPILGTEYPIDGASDDDKKMLAAQGFDFISVCNKDLYDFYRNCMTERSAFLITPTFGVRTRVDLYRLVNRSK